MLNGLIAFTVWISGGRLEPREYDMKEYWSWKGGGTSPWFMRAWRQKGCFGANPDPDESSKRSFTMNEENESTYGDNSGVGSPATASRQREDDEIAVISTPKRTYR